MSTSMDSSSHYSKLGPRQIWSGRVCGVRNWPLSVFLREQIGAPAESMCPRPAPMPSSVAVAVRALILASTTTLTPIQLPPPLLTRGRPTERPPTRRRGDGTCFLRAPSSFSLSLKLTSSSFKLGAGNDLGVATPMLLLLYARCLAARRTGPVQSLSKCGLLREEDVIHLRNGRARKKSGAELL